MSIALAWDDIQVQVPKRGSNTYELLPRNYLSAHRPEPFDYLVLMTGEVVCAPVAYLQPRLVMLTYPTMPQIFSLIAYGYEPPRLQDYPTLLMRNRATLFPSASTINTLWQNMSNFAHAVEWITLALKFADPDEAQSTEMRQIMVRNMIKYGFLVPTVYTGTYRFASQLYEIRKNETEDQWADRLALQIRDGLDYFNEQTSKTPS